MYVDMPRGFGFLTLAEGYEISLTVVVQFT